MPPRRVSRLRHVSDAEPGYLRSGRGRRIRYTDEVGAPLRDPAVLARIRALAIPPAWVDVWISPDPYAHLQATGRDGRGRKQYRYHPEWRRRRDAEKFERVVRLARRLPRLRRVVDADLRRRGLPRDKVLAIVVRLLELTQLRVGNDAYVRVNRSYGLTTLRDRQARVAGSRIHFRFRGKGGRWQEVEVVDRRLARLVRRLQDLPGSRLFEYLDDTGARHAISSEDVNDYLRTSAGADITAKDFRTWGATVLAFRALRLSPHPGDGRVARRQIQEAMEQTAGRLGNTVAVTRSSYVAPSLVAAWEDGDLARLRSPRERDRPVSGPATPEEEAAVLRLLERRRRAARHRIRSGVPRPPRDGSSRQVASGTLLSS